MSTDTELIGKEKEPVESRVWGISLRGLLALFLVTTVCLSTVFHVIAVLIISIIQGSMDAWATYTIGEPLYSMSVAALGFYFGQQKVPTQTGKITG